jgi:hypothetical protein
MKYPIELPNEIKDSEGRLYEPTGEWRTACNEWVLGSQSHAAIYIKGPTINAAIILRRKLTPLERLKKWHEHYQKFRDHLHAAYPQINNDPNCESLGAIIADLEGGA